MTDIASWNKTDGSNTASPPGGAPEGMLPGKVNDTIRAIMGAVARYVADNNAALSTGGSSNAYTLTPNQAIGAYARGQTFMFLSNHTNTGSATLNVSSLGARSIKTADGSNIVAGDIVSGGAYLVVYDGTQFQLFGGYTNIETLNISSVIGVDLSDSVAPLVVSPGTGQHLELDGNDIQSKTNATTAGTLAINRLGGNVAVGPQSGSGRLQVWHNGGEVANSSALGMDLIHAAGIEPTLRFYQSGGSTLTAYIEGDGSNGLDLRSQVASAPVTISGKDAGGTDRLIGNFDPDAGSTLYYNGAQSLRVGATFLGFYGQTTDDPWVALFQSDGTTRGGYFQSHSTLGVRLINEIAGTPISLLADDTGATQRSVFVGDPDGAATLYYAGSAKLATASGGVTVTGVVTSTTLSVSGAASVGALTATSLTVGGVALNEQIADVAGAMFSGNTETNITATYQDGDNTIDLIVSDASESLKGVIEIATAAEAKAGSSNILALTPGRFAGNTSLASSGYYTFPGGLTVAWGITSSLPNAALSTVSLPLTFTAIYQVVASPNLSVLPGGGEGSSVFNPTTTTFQIRNQTGLSATFRYFAVGLA